MDTVAEGELGRSANGSGVTDQAPKLHFSLDWGATNQWPRQSGAPSPSIQISPIPFAPPRPIRSRQSLLWWPSLYSSTDRGEI